MDASKLAVIPLFAGLPDADLATIASAALEVQVEAGETLAAQGQTGHALFAILSGTADVIADGAKRAVLGPGDVFGEIAMLAAGHRTASVVATSRMTLIALFNDGVLVPNTTDYHSTLKHTDDAPLTVAFTGPIPGPGLTFFLQAFIVNFAAGPPFTMVSTNAIRGRIW